MRPPAIAPSRPPATPPDRVTRRALPLLPRRQGLLTPVLLALLTGAGLPAQSAPPVPTPAAATAAPNLGDTVVLSPFVVSQDSEKGYLATETLNGTRIKTSLNDVGAPMSIFTEELMRDLGANSINDILSFAPNTDPYTGSQNDTFFGTNIPADRYNSENFTFTRGPNAILFGLSNPAGAFLSSTKRALFKDRYTVELRGDSNGSRRAMVDLNQVIAPGKLAVRYAGLYEDSEGFRDPSDGSQRRHFLTASYTPFKQTTLRFNVEDGEHYRLAVRPWPVYDGLTPWLLAGSPLLPSAGSPLNVPGIQNVGANPTLVITDYSPTGAKVDPLSWRNMGRSANSSFPATPNVNGKASLTDPALFPLDANVLGSGSSRKSNFTTWTIFLEQQLARDLFFEGAIHHVKEDTIVNNSFVGDFDRIYIDVNRQLPNGQPEPSVARHRERQPPQSRRDRRARHVHSPVPRRIPPAMAGAARAARDPLGQRQHQDRRPDRESNRELPRQLRRPLRAARGQPADAGLGLEFHHQVRLCPRHRPQGLGRRRHAARMRGRAVVGFAEINGVLDPSRPYYTGETSDVGAILSYQYKLFKKFDCRAQLNVNNVLESGGLKVQRMVDPRDGTGIGREVIFRVLEPRTYVLSLAFSF